MSNPSVAAANLAALQPKSRRWTSVAGAWLGIGTSPGALLLGAGIAARYGGAVPLVSILTSFLLMFILLWFQGLLGMGPPYGEGGNLHQITPSFFGPLMQRTVGAVIGLGMIGWFGFNVGLGGAALNALLGLPQAAGPLLISLPILILSLKGIRSWNWLATLTTVAVIVLVILVMNRLAGSGSPVRIKSDSTVSIVTDVAVFIGYISVFSVRAPDFSAGLSSRKDLVISALLLCITVVAIALAGVSLQQGTGSADLVNILAKPGSLPIGNLLIAISVIAPTFTTLYSGAPSLQAAVGLRQDLGMILITTIGVILALVRFDLLLISWLSVLAAMLPPLIVPLAVESTLRRRGHTSHLIPIWAWLPGSAVSILLTFLHHPLAPLLGLCVSALGTLFWYFSARKAHPQTL